jgi:putative nucleotidyltransferase with HDIG domain
MSGHILRPQGGDVGEAWDVAENLLNEALPRRWLHCRGVWTRAMTTESELADRDAQLLAQAAVLHDVGYAPDLAVTGFHPLDGARYLRSIGLDERVVSLVAHHSCARVEAEERGLGPALGEFESGPPELTAFLIFCDMTTSPDGLPVSIDERLVEIRRRYGSDSIVGRSITRAEPELRAATFRVIHRLGLVTRPTGG